MRRDAGQQRQGGGDGGAADKQRTWGARQARQQRGEASFISHPRGPLFIRLGPVDGRSKCERIEMRGKKSRRRRRDDTRVGTGTPTLAPWRQWHSSGHVTSPTSDATLFNQLHDGARKVPLGAPPWRPGPSRRLPNASHQPRQRQRMGGAARPPRVDCRLSVTRSVVAGRHRLHGPLGPLAGSPDAKRALNRKKLLHHEIVHRSEAKRRGRSCRVPTDDQRSTTTTGAMGRLHLFSARRLRRRARKHS